MPPTLLHRVPGMTACQGQHVRTPDTLGLCAMTGLPQGHIQKEAGSEREPGTSLALCLPAGIPAPVISYSPSHEGHSEQTKERNDESRQEPSAT